MRRSTQGPAVMMLLAAGALTSAGFVAPADAAPGDPGPAALGVNIDGDPGSDHGVVIRGVHPGGPAEAAGLRAQDVILFLDGNAIRRIGDRSCEQELAEYMRSVEPGRRVRVEYLRSGKRQTTEVATRRVAPARVRMIRNGNALEAPATGQTHPATSAQPPLSPAAPPAPPSPLDPD